MGTVEQQSGVSARDGRAFKFLKKAGAAWNEFFPGVGAMLHFASKDVDTLTLPGLPQGVLSAGDEVKVQYSGSGLYETVFVGTVESIMDRRGAGTDRVQDIVCQGPWGKMNRLVFRQTWGSGNATFSSARIILNQSALGESFTMTQQLAEILSFASVKCGFSYSAANVSAAEICLPKDETRDVTCASAVQRELRFFPKKIVRFDYSGATPSVHISEPSGSGDASYLADIPKTARIYEYTAHPITAVDVYTTDIDVDGDDKLRTLGHQIYPSNADTSSLDCLHAYIPLEPGSASTSWESLDSETEDLPDSLDDANWWKSKHPRLANVALSELTISDGARADLNEYPRIAKSTAGELKKAGLHSGVERFTAKATIATDADKEEDILLSMDFLMTDARTKRYTWQTGSSWTEGETLPQGLAQAIYEQRSGALLNERVTVRLGDSLPVLGDCADGLLLQEYDVDLEGLTAELHFGQPEYLSVEDMRDLLNGFRQRAYASTALLRTGDDEDDEEEEEGEATMGGIKPIASTEFSPGSKAKTTFAGADTLSGAEADGDSIVVDTTGESPNIVLSGESGNRKIELDTDDFPNGVTGTVKLRKITYRPAGSNEASEVVALLSDDINLDSGKYVTNIAITRGQNDGVIGGRGWLDIVVTYSDGSTASGRVYDGRNGDPGSDGQDGDTPEITSEKIDGHTRIYADGELIATIDDGATPEIDAQKVGKTTTIYVNGNAIAQIEDGEDGEGGEGVEDYESITCISGIRFEKSDGKLKAYLSKTSFNVPNTEELHPVETVDAEDIEVCNASEVEVVTSEEYSTSTHQFTNTRRKITVMGDDDATGQTPFTATSIADE